MSSSAPEDFCILLVDDDPLVVTLLGRVLRPLAQVRFALSGADALRQAAQHRPDVILLDLQMPDMSGFEVCAALKRSPALAAVPIIVITGHAGNAEESKAYDLGVADVLLKPSSPAHICARVSQQLRVVALSRELRVASGRDPLTGLVNRLSFDESLQQESLRALRAGTPLSLLKVAVDVSGALDPESAEQGLSATGAALRGVVRRPADLLARYADDVFAMLLPETPAHGVCCVARAALHAIQTLTPSAWPVRIGASAHQATAGELGRSESGQTHVVQARQFAAELTAATEQALQGHAELRGDRVRYLSMTDLGDPERACDVTADGTFPSA